MSTQAVGFVGLGAMGRVMARRLVAAGYTVFVWNRTPLSDADLQAEHWTRAATPAEAARNGLVISMLADDAAVDTVSHGEDGVLSGLPEGGLHVGMSTIGVALAQRLAQSHSDARRHYISAPVFGRPEAAAAGKLWIVNAGEADACARAQPLFEALGQGQFYIGTAPAQANTLKLAGNFMLMSMLETMGEVLALTGKAGIPARTVMDMLTGTLFKSPVYELYGKLVAEQRFEPAGFKLRLGLKDANLVLAAANASATPMPLASLVHNRLLAGVARGRGEQDWAALTQLVAEDAGLGG